MSLSLFTKSAFTTSKAMGLNPMRSVVAATFHSSTFSAQATPATPQWTVDSVRTGVIAKKKGMTSVWSEAGVRMPVTVLQVN
jgi:large subunit ribosomal protein L3